MTKSEILERLNVITSYFSFGRVLGYIEFKEEVGIENQLINEQKSNRERLISNEIKFLAALWLQNVDIKKRFAPTEDDCFIDEVYYLMNELHLKYAHSGKYEDLFVEQFFYEGDLAYDWQYTMFASKKYQHQLLAATLKEKFKFDIDRVGTTLNKIKNILVEQIKQRRETKRKKHEYISPMNAFTIKPNVLKKKFTIDEQNIIKSLSIKLEEEFSPKISSIEDYNRFRETPIIELPQDRGWFFVEEGAVAIALNEIPHQWLLKTLDNNKYSQIRGDVSEQIVSEIIQRRFSDNCLKHVEIKKYKTSKKSGPVTDIDVFFSYKDVGVVFQVKSKNLTGLSFKGDIHKIEDDTNKAFMEAYEQGKKCITCLKEASQYYTLNKAGLSYCENLELYNICVTLDAFPSISVLSFLRSQGNSGIPLIAMSIYDLDTILYLFQPSVIIDYIRFRAECSRCRIVGLNEVYYIGAFLAKYQDRHVKLQGNKICREYALYADYIIKKAKHGEFAHKDVDCNIFELMEKYPITSPITCQ